MAPSLLSPYDDLIARIYEAAALPQLWPDTLQQIAQAVGAKGAVFINQSPTGLSSIVSPVIEEVVAAYMAAGWVEEGSRTAPLIAEMYPGFRAELDYRTAEELNALGAYQDVLLPRGHVGGAGTAMQGVGHAGLHMAVEDFGSHEAARLALPLLNRLRPHLGRALSLSAKLSADRADLIVSSLGAAGVAAAVVTRNGGMQSCNEAFDKCLRSHIVDPLGRLRFLDARANALFGESLTRSDDPATGSRSFALFSEERSSPIGIHVIPIPRRARDLFAGEGLLLIASDGHNQSIPNADLLRMLFDLTPAEATLARLLLEGLSVEQAAARLKVKEGTARVHLRAIFAKTGTIRQSQLVQLLSGYAVGTSTSA